MDAGLRASLTPEFRAKLRAAMDWVIPPDSSSGAGTALGAQLLVDLVDSLDSEVASAYLANLPGLTESDLANEHNAFAQMFIEQVRDVYYGNPATGSWADIGFVVTGS